eukprot:2214277-Rhodomonas_salina.1
MRAARSLQLLCAAVLCVASHAFHPHPALNIRRPMLKKSCFGGAQAPMHQRPSSMPVREAKIHGGWGVRMPKLRGVRDMQAEAQAGGGSGGRGDFNWWTEWYPMAPVHDLQADW